MPTPRKLARKSSRQRTLTNPSVTNRRRRLLEALEQRVLLASDFTFNADPSAADVRLYTDSGRLILEDSDGTELKSEALADVENIELDGSGLSDKFRIGDLSGFFGTLTVDGDNGRDKVIFDGLVTMLCMIMTFLLTSMMPANPRTTQMQTKCQDSAVLAMEQLALPIVQVASLANVFGISVPSFSLRK